MEELSWIMAIIVACLIGLSICVPELEKQEETRKAIVEKTEEYTKHDYCEKIDNIWYCFNEE